MSCTSLWAKVLTLLKLFSIAHNIFSYDAVTGRDSNLSPPRRPVEAFRVAGITLNLLDSHEDLVVEEEKKDQGEDSGKHKGCPVYIESRIDR